MTPATTALDHDEALVAELHDIGVDHLARLSAAKPARPIAPADLIAGLAVSNDARLQAALILLFLRQPSFNQYLPEALHQLSREAAITLKLYYQAAIYLQDELQSELKASLADWQRLPDLFSAELGLPPPGDVSTTAGLHVLGKRHEELTGWAYNWCDSYRQNISRFLKHLRHAHGHYRP